MTPPGNIKIFAYIFSQKRSANQGKKMPGNEINMKTSLFVRNGYFWAKLKKQNAKSYTYAVLAPTPSSGLGGGGGGGSGPPFRLERF